MDAGARYAKIAALVLMGLGVAFFLMFAVGETAAGEISGVQHFPPAVILAALMYVAWKRPLAAGRALLVISALLVAAVVAVLVVGRLPSATGLLVSVVLPAVLTGLLLVRAGRGEHRPG
jgi:hypothetical protein